MKHTRVMGIVNVTPDSFSDGGLYFKPEEAVRRALNLLAEGADILDLGGESTRPGATPVGWKEEWKRLEPVLAALLPRCADRVPISIDTYHAETAQRALAAGARIINCVSREATPGLLALCAEAGAELVFPAAARDALDAALLARVPHYLDPMVGFGTTRDEDLELIRSIPRLAEEGRVLVGVSRKRIVKKLTGEKVTGKNLGGNLALALWCATNGADVVRVHDVRETVQALCVYAAL